VRRITASLVEMSGALTLGVCAWLLDPYVFGMVAGAALVALAQFIPVDAPTEKADL
jgi:hypothetical protein